MKPLSFKIIQGVSCVFFIVALFLFALSHVVTVASKRVEVTNKEDQVIGEAWISHDYGSDQFLCFSLAVLGGVQFYALRLVGRKIYTDK
jgi:hypothetical protein